MSQLKRLSLGSIQEGDVVKVAMVEREDGEYFRADDVFAFLESHFAPLRALKTTAPTLEQPAGAVDIDVKVTEKQPPAPSKNKTGRFSDEETEYLRNSYKTLTVAQIAHNMRRTKGAVANKLMQLGLNSRKSARFCQSDTTSKPALPAKLEKELSKKGQESVPQQEHSETEYLKAGESADLSNIFIRPIPESAKPGSGRQHICE